MEDLNSNETPFIRNNRISKTTITTKDKIDLDKRVINAFTTFPFHIDETINVEIPKKAEVYSRDLEFSNIITILRKNPSNRSPKDISILVKFFESSKLAQVFENSTSENLHLINQVLIQFAKFAKYKSCDKDQYLFLEGDIGDKFYFIVKGSVKVIKLKDVETKMNPQKYLAYIESIKDDKFILKRVLKHNQEAFNITLANISDLTEIRENLMWKISNDISKNQSELTNLLEKGKQRNQEEKNPSTKSASKLKNLNPEMIRFDFIRKPFEEKIVRKVEYHELEILETGNYFGDISLENKTNSRTASILALEDVHLGEISISEYRQNILKIKQGVELVVSDVITRSFFYSFTTPRNFFTNYFHMLVYKQASYNDVICKEGENMKNIFFIKEGQIEFLFNKNLIKFSEIIKNLDTYLNLGNTVSKVEELYFEDPKNKKIVNSINFISVLKSNENFTIGIPEFLFKFPQFFEIRVISGVLKYYTMTINNFENLISKESELSIILRDKAYQQGKLIYTSMREILNVYINEYEEKISDKLQEIEKEKIESAKKAIEKKMTVAAIYSKMKFPGIKINSITPFMDQNSNKKFERKIQRMSTEVVSKNFISSRLLNNYQEEKKNKTKFQSTKHFLTIENSIPETSTSPKTPKQIKTTKIILDESIPEVKQEDLLEKEEIIVKNYPLFQKLTRNSLKKGILKSKTDLNNHNEKNDKEIQFII